MDSKLLHERDGARTFLLVFDSGETLMGPLRRFLDVASVKSARFTGVGALQSATLGYFDWESKEYEQHQLDGQFELLSLVGDVALDEQEPQVHAHAVVGLRDTSTRGGHLIEATVRPTLELVLDDTPAYLRKRHDRESGLALIAPSL